MKIKIILFQLIITILLSANEKQYSIKKIKYLTPETLNENIMRNYLGFKEGDIFTEKKLDFILESARLRLKEYGIFNTVEILSNDSTETPDSKIIYISLEEGFNNTINAGLWWAQVGWKNLSKRGDYIGFYAGINKNEIENIIHLPSGNIFFEQKTGWSFPIDTPFFPFFPLYGEENNYENTIYSLLGFGFIVTSDITFGLTTGIKNLFNLSIKNLSNIETTNYNFSYDYSIIPLGGYLSINKKYLANKWYSGFYGKIEGYANFDVYNKVVYPELKSNFRGAIFPNSYISIINTTTSLNRFMSNYNYSIYRSVRGRITKDEGIGNFLITNSLDFRVKLFQISSGAITNQIGLSNFYEACFVANDYNISYINHFSIVGGGMWMKLGTPVNLTIFAELGYTVGKSFEDGYKINIGVGDFF